MEKILKTKEGFLFKQVTVPDDKLPCDFCPYSRNEFCDNIPDPNGEPDKSFLDYCNDLSYENEDSFAEAVPIEGTIEKVLGIDLMETVIKKNPIVRVDKVIDTLCPDFCDQYSKDHKNCNSTNRTCILKKLLT